MHSSSGLVVVLTFIGRGVACSGMEEFLGGF